MQVTLHVVLRRMMVPDHAIFVSASRSQIGSLTGILMKMAFTINVPAPRAAVIPTLDFRDWSKQVIAGRTYVL